MSDPLVSVILPTYNRTGLLERAMASVLAQDYRAIELIVVDDASSEDIAAVVEGFGDPRARCLRCERNVGAAAARNVGLEAARGEFIAFQDSDDLWLQDKLRKQVDALRVAGPDIGFVYTDVARLAENMLNIFPGRTLGQDRQRLSDVALGDGILFSYTQSWLVRADALRAAGPFDPAFRRWEDWDLCIRLTRVCDGVRVPGVHVISQRMEDSITTDPTLAVPALRRLVDKHANSSAARSRGGARLLYTQARAEFLYGERRRGWQALCRSLAMGPSLRGFALGLLAAIRIERAVIFGRHPEARPPASP